MSLEQNAYTTKRYAFGIFGKFHPFQLLADDGRGIEELTIRLNLLSIILFRAVYRPDQFLPSTLEDIFKSIFDLLFSRSSLLDSYRSESLSRDRAFLSIFEVSNKMTDNWI